MRAARNEKGMVLLLVLVVVALLTSLVTEFAFSTLVDMRLTETFRDSTRAWYLAK
ncbi:MAG: general secretion pathway protein GspK, partial [Desulfuromonadales bacterium]|nr:general secretion pathway protein GspK [Desulfuromonadales bacterium]